MTPVLLAGDVGGTKTDFGLFTAEPGPAAPIATARVPTAEHASLADGVQAFLRTTGMRPRYACLAVAGPVIGGRARMTHVPWTLDAADLARELDLAAVWLLNDVQAAARAVPDLEADAVHVVRAGQPELRGTRAVLTPGTGVGEAFLTWDGARFHAHPSEGGHALFAPATPIERDLVAYLEPRIGRVSVEAVCSGGFGIPNVYEFLRDRGDRPESSDIARAFAESPDRGRVVTEGAFREPEPDPLCRSALELVVSLLAAEAAQLAVRLLALGGVYLAGGIVPRLLPLLPSRIETAWAGLGPMVDVASRIPVYLLRTRVALRGAAAHGLERMRAIAS